jgi:formate hydrogenlyase subunit 6/NADH:ubiquinone oxidoreductase subunit I
MSFFSIGKLITRSAVSKPATRLYPVEVRDIFEHTRGRIDIDIDTCVFCNICAKKCPTDAILVTRKEKTWQIDHLSCILCGHCVEVCPKHCLTQKNTAAPPMTSREVEIHKAEEKAEKATEAKA